MRKILLILSFTIFIISIDECYFKLATEICDARIMREWQWISIGVYFFILQALVYNCHMTTRVERVILILCSSSLYNTISVIVFTLAGRISNPYIKIISYNYMVFVLLIIIIIGSFYSNTFNIGFRFKNRIRKAKQ